MKIYGVGAYTKRCARGYETYMDIKMSCVAVKQDEQQHRKQTDLTKLFDKKNESEN